MKTVLRSLMIISLAFIFSNCASIFSSSSWPLTVNTDPNGARVIINNKKGIEVYNGVTPATMTLKSGAGYFGAAKYSVTLRLDGYEDKVIPVTCSLNGWYLGNLLLGGVLGMLIIDPLTGAMYKLDQSVISTQMTKGNGTASSNPALKIVNIADVPDNLKPSLEQIDKFVATGQGKFVISGNTNIGFDNSSVKNYRKTSTFSFSPTFDYFIIDNLAIGLSGTLESGSTKYETGGKSNWTYLNVMPNILYYFPLEGKMKPFAQVGYGIFSNSGSSSSTSKGSNLKIGAGMAYFVRNNISFDFGLSYNINKFKNSLSKTNTLGSNIGISVYF